MSRRSTSVAAFFFTACLSACGSTPAESLTNPEEGTTTSSLESSETSRTDLANDDFETATTELPPTIAPEPVETTVAPAIAPKTERAVGFVDEDGTQLWTDSSTTTLSELPGWNLRWSRDGAWLTFSTIETVVAYEEASGKVFEWPCEECNGAIVVDGKVVSLQTGGTLQIVDLTTLEQYEVSTDLAERVLAQFNAGAAGFPIAEAGNGIIVDASIDGRSAYGGPTNLWHISLEGQVTELGPTTGNVGLFRSTQDSSGSHLAYAEGWRGGFCSETHGVALVDLSTYQTVLVPHPLEGDELTENLWLSHLAWVGDVLYSTWSTSTTDPEFDGGGCEQVLDYTDYRLTDGSWERLEETGHPFTQPFGGGTLRWIEEGETEDPNEFVPTNLEVDGEIIGYGVSSFATSPEAPSTEPAASPLASFAANRCPVDVGETTRLTASFETAGFDVTVCGPFNGMYWYHGRSKSSGNEILLDGGYYAFCSMYVTNSEEGVTYEVDPNRLVVTGPERDVLLEEPVTTHTC